MNTRYNRVRDKALRILPYKADSHGARIMAEGLDALRLRLPVTYEPPRNGVVVVNWGNTNAGALDLHTRDFRKLRWINYPGAVKNASNKLVSLNTFRAAGVPTLEYTTDIDEARRWAEEGTVIQRNIVNGSRGAGIVVCRGGVMPSENGRLWTKYFRKVAEYRVHVVGGHVILVHQKRKRSGVDADRFVRSYENGWVFCTENVECPNEVKHAAINAVAALCLDFGAVDVAYSKKNGVAVFEVNTAPGLDGPTTQQAYIDAIGKIAKSYRVTLEVAA